MRQYLKNTCGNKPCVEIFGAIPHRPSRLAIGRRSGGVHVQMSSFVDKVINRRDQNFEVNIS